MVAGSEYRPVACKKSYRMIVTPQAGGDRQGQMRLFEDYRYFFYITNDRKMTAEEVVFSANDRCDQENLIAQLKNGVPALTAARGRPGEQLGVYGDGVAGLGSEGLEPPFWCRCRHGTARNMNQRNESCCGWSSRRSARLSFRCPARSCEVDAGWFTGCCRGTPGKGSSSDWSSGCTHAGYAK